MSDNRVWYGIDTFYLPQDGSDPSRLPLSFALRVSARGRAQIVELLVQGRPCAEWNAAQKAR